jgi:hypothetical protein
MLFRRRLLSLLFAGAAPILAAVAPAFADEPDGAGRPADAGLAGLHAAIETAFSRCDAAALRSAFPRRLKSWVGAPTLGIEEGYYGADQAILILRRAFATRTTLRFAFETPRPAPAAATPATAPARWSFRQEGIGRMEIRLLFTVARDGATWTIREIREVK